MESRWIVALKSALRSLIPIVVAIAALIDWHNIVSWRSLQAAVIGAAVKYISTLWTAKSVEVDEK